MTAVRRTLDVLLIVLVVGSIGMAIASAVAPAFGHRLFAIRSGSMAPAIQVGSLVVASAVDPRAVRVGDVVSIALPSRTVVTHRVVAIEETGDARAFMTKGDANASADPVAVPGARVVGRVGLTMPVVGFLLGMISMPTGIAALLSIGGSLLTALWLLDELESDDEPALENNLFGIPG